MNKIRAMWATRNAHEYIKHCEAVASDADRARRVYEQECRRCYYSQKVGGSMMTESQCQGCGTKMRFPNTSVDQLCIGCAKALKFCKHCGGDINSNPRRRKWA